MEKLNLDLRKYNNLCHFFFFFISNNESLYNQSQTNSIINICSVDCINIDYLHTEILAHAKFSNTMARRIVFLFIIEYNCEIVAKVGPGLVLSTAATIIFSLTHPFFAVSSPSASSLIYICLFTRFSTPLFLEI